MADDEKKIAQQIQRFCANVRVMRLVRGETQEELALILGLNQHNLSALEHGRRKPSLTAAIRIADKLGYTITELLTIDYEQ